MKKKEATTTVIVPTAGTITSDITLGLEKSDDPKIRKQSQWQSQLQ